MDSRWISTTLRFSVWRVCASLACAAGCVLAEAEPEPTNSESEHKPKASKRRRRGPNLVAQRATVRGSYTAFRELNRGADLCSGLRCPRLSVSERVASIYPSAEKGCSRKSVSGKRASRKPSLHTPAYLYGTGAYGGLSLNITPRSSITLQHDWMDIHCRSRATACSTVMSGSPWPPSLISLSLAARITDRTRYPSPDSPRSSFLSDSYSPARSSINR